MNTSIYVLINIPLTIPSRVNLLTNLSFSANWDRRFDHRIRLAKKNFEDDIIARPETRARYSGRNYMCLYFSCSAILHLFKGYIILECLFTFTEAEDQADIDQAIKLLLEKYLVSKNDVSKRDYIRLM